MGFVGFEHLGTELLENPLMADAVELSHDHSWDGPTEGSVGAGIALLRRKFGTHPRCSNAMA